MAIGQNFYADQPEQDFANLSRLQSSQALGYGDQAARYADPFMDQRKQYQNQLSNLMANPGSFASSPTYQFAFNQGLEALNRRSAASGKTGSGNYLADLMKYGQGMASQQFFPQANLLAQLAQGGSSPAAAGLSYARGADRSQDYAQLSQMAKSAGQNKGQPQNNGQSWLDRTSAEHLSRQGGGTGLPSGGAMPYGGGMQGGMSGQVDPWSAGYTPSAGAGQGYMLGNNMDAGFGGGNTDFYGFGGGDMGGGSFAGGGGDYSIPDYSGDFGGGDYLGGYGGEEW